MSVDVLKEILGRIDTDAEFRSSIIYFADEALAEYDLTDAERAAFRERSFGGLDIPPDLARALRNQLDTSGI